MKLITKKQIRETIAVGGVAGCGASYFQHPIRNGWTVGDYILYIVIFQLAWAVTEIAMNVWREIWTDDEEHECKGIDCDVCEKEEN